MNKYNIFSNTLPAKLKLNVCRTCNLPSAFLHYVQLALMCLDKICQAMIQHRKHLEVSILSRHNLSDFKEVLMVWKNFDYLCVTQILLELNLLLQMILKIQAEKQLASILFMHLFYLFYLNIL